MRRLNYKNFILISGTILLINNFISLPKNIDILVVSILLLSIITVTIISILNKINDKTKINDDKKSIIATLETLFVALSSFSSGDMTKGANFDTGFKNLEDKELRELISQNINEFNAITDNPTGRLCFAGNNGYQEGQLIGEQIGKELNGQGEVLISLVAIDQVLHLLRAKGCVNYLAQNFKNIKVHTMYRGDEENWEPPLIDYFNKHSDIDALYLTDGAGAAMAKLLKGINHYNNVKIFEHDIAGDTMNSVRTGEVTYVIAENFYAETHNSLVYLYNHLETGWTPSSNKLYMEPILVNKDTCANHWNFNKDERVLTQFELNQLEKPFPRRNNKKWKLALILPIGKDTWFDMAYRGAMKAKESLKKLDIEVDVIDAFDGYETFGKYEAFNPIIDRLIAEGYDGFSTCLFENRIAECVRKATSKDIAVTTYSNEPINFREIITNISNNFDTLHSHSSELASAAEESSRANVQINSFMESIADSSKQQQQHMLEADKNINTLTENINSVNSTLEDYVDSVDSMNSAAQMGVISVNESKETSQALSRSISDINNSLISLNDKLVKIRSIITTIDTFSSDTNVLAINASIQAAHAGEKGNSFAVIAGNIRKLSEKSSVATEQINSLIKDINFNMEDIVNRSGDNFKQVQLNNEKVNKAGDSFSSIAENIQRSSKDVQNVKSSITDVLKVTMNIKDGIDFITEMNQENTNSIGEITISIRELSSQSNDLNETAHNLLEMARSQDVVLNQLSFKGD